MISDNFKCIDPNIYFINKGDLLKFNSGDGIIVPISFQYVLNLEMTLLSIKVSYNLHSTYGKIIDFNNCNSIVMPNWMTDALSINYNEIVNVEIINLSTISEISIISPKNISDPKCVLEYLLQNHSISYLNKQISTKIFDQIYTFIIFDQLPHSVGIIYNCDVIINIKYNDV